MVVFAEVGLTGELRAVSRPAARLTEAARQGFSVALTAPGPAPRVEGMRLMTAGRLAEALEMLRA